MAGQVPNVPGAEGIKLWSQHLAPNKGLEKILNGA